MFAPVPGSPTPPFGSGVSTPSAPVANFTGTPTSGTAPLAVQFTDTSTNTPTSWAWTFGDGDTSTLQNPLHTYLAAGTYTVVLTATNAIGSGIKTRTNYITVTASPVVITTDTHDGFDGKKKRYEEESRKKEQLRYLLQHAFDPDKYPWPIPEPSVVELADEFVEKKESGIEIDWDRLERENIVRAQLYAMAAEFERQRQEFEEDEEDVLTLLLH